MAVHHQRGNEGELLAGKYLTGQGYHIQHQNWRTSYYEIDIIAVKENILHFIEVKTRHSLRFGHPEESVSKKKMDNLKKAAAFYCRCYPHWKRMQFDILAITRIKGRPDEFLLIEDVYL